MWLKLYDASKKKIFVYEKWSELFTNYNHLFDFSFENESKNFFWLFNEKINGRKVEWTIIEEILN